MKIAMIGQKGVPAVFGGIEKHVEELGAQLAKKHEVLAYARNWYTPKNITEYKGMKIIHCGTLHTKHLDAIVHTFISTLDAIFLKKVDVIHYHGVGPSLLSFIPRILSPKTKVISTFHCIDRYHQKWNWFARTMLALGEKAACTFAHQTIAVSKTIQNYALNEYKCYTVYNPNGVMKVGENVGNTTLKEFGLEKDKYLVMISRLVAHKGAHYLIKAFKNAKAKNPQILKDYKLAIVGGSAFTDKYVNYLHRLADNDKDIVFTGNQSGKKLVELYANAKMLIHPSENEGLPITVLQAMSHRLPVLVSDIPEHQEVVTDSQFWFTNASILSLTNKIVGLLKNPTLLETAGKKNKQTAERNYAWEDIAKKTENIYQLDEKEKVLKLKTV
ncbi:MAG: glycosyltransferase family 4 protein [Candidatus Magasanikbacteria bacterium]|nr:glycosyltransferase family 4 protein [Candidatus Magasanikbacteria bacterium]